MSEIEIGETIGELLRNAQKCTTRKEAAAFLRAYEAVEPVHAKQNLGYVIGYCSDDERKRLYDLFDLEHPFFGRMIV